MSAVLRDSARYPGSFWGASSGQIPLPFRGRPGPRCGGCRVAARRPGGERGAGLRSAALPIS